MTWVRGQMWWLAPVCKLLIIATLTTAFVVAVILLENQREVARVEGKR